MDAPTAAAIGSFCTLALGLVSLGVQVILAERVRQTHDLVNSKSVQLEALISKSAYAEGLKAGNEGGTFPDATAQSKAVDIIQI